MILPFLTSVVVLLFHLFIFFIRLCHFWPFLLFLCVILSPFSFICDTFSLFPGLTERLNESAGLERTLTLDWQAQTGSLWWKCPRAASTSSPAGASCGAHWNYIQQLTLKHLKITHKTQGDLPLKQLKITLKIPEHFTLKYLDTII